LNPVLTQDINYRASLRLARLAKKSGVERFIFSSSCSVYGVSGQEMIDENGVVAPATEYAKSKVDAEKDISGLADTGFSPVFLRNATVYGISPMLRVDLVVNNLAAWAYTTGNIKVMSDGSPWRPLIHIQDISKAFIAALKAPKNIVHNQIFNVGQNSGNYRVREIVEVIKSQMPECNIEFTGEHGADTRTYRVEFSKFNSLLKDYFKPEWNIEKGVKEVLGSYRSVDLKEGAFLGEKFTRLKRINALLKQKKLDKSLRWNTSR
ncbi:MAG: SDR family oxidoreductase, partial [Candidatus Omnitrophica bacterium]|nr:SDR family oxidoreductase [Candidatus Omnitrophota bacterium]